MTGPWLTDWLTYPWMINWQTDWQTLHWLILHSLTDSWLTDRRRTEWHLMNWRLTDWLSFDTIQNWLHLCESYDLLVFTQGSLVQLLKGHTRARTCTQMRSCTHTCSCTHTDKHASAHIHCKSERQSAVAGWPNSFSNFLAGVCITPSAFNLLCSVSDLVPPPQNIENKLLQIYILKA